MPITYPYIDEFNGVSWAATAAELGAQAGDLLFAAHGRDGGTTSEMAASTGSAAPLTYHGYNGHQVAQLYVYRAAVVDATGDYGMSHSDAASRWLVVLVRGVDVGAGIVHVSRARFSNAPYVIPSATGPFVASARCIRP